MFNINIINGRGVARTVGKAYAAVPVMLIVGAVALMALFAVGIVPLIAFVAVIVLVIVRKFVRDFRTGYRRELARRRQSR